MHADVLVVAPDREDVFRGDHELEIAAKGVVAGVVLGTDEAVAEAAHLFRAAHEEAVEDRRVAGGEADGPAQQENVGAAEEVVGLPLEQLEELEVLGVRSLDQAVDGGADADSALQDGKSAGSREEQGVSGVPCKSDGRSEHGVAAFLFLQILVVALIFQRDHAFLDAAVVSVDVAALDPGGVLAHDGVAVIKRLVDADPDVFAGQRALDLDDAEVFADGRDPGHANGSRGPEVAADPHDPEVGAQGVVVLPVDVEAGRDFPSLQLLMQEVRLGEA